MGPRWAAARGSSPPPCEHKDVFECNPERGGPQRSSPWGLSRRGPWGRAQGLWGVEHRRPQPGEEAPAGLYRAVSRGGGTAGWPGAGHSGGRAGPWCPSAPAQPRRQEMEVGTAQAAWKGHPDSALTPVVTAASQEAGKCPEGDGAVGAATGQAHVPVWDVGEEGGHRGAVCPECGQGQAPEEEQPQRCGGLSWCKGPGVGVWASRVGAEAEG